MKIPILTACCLVLLRVAIGWHLFYEGAWKEQHAETWSSQGFLRAANGPGALPSRWLAGDPNVTRDGWRFEEHLPPPPPDPAAEPLARLNVPPIPEDKRGKVDAYHDYLPAPLKAEWEAYAQRFVQYYGLDGAGQDKIRTVVSRHEDDTVRWLLEGEKKVPRQSSATGT